MAQNVWRTEISFWPTVTVEYDFIHQLQCLSVYFYDGIPYDEPIFESIFQKECPKECFCVLIP